ncbi:hypothetical protein OsI_00305 [Oryza sativa Indica Group]|uniref:Wall-associated receptor kinase galacturonan-binding domain-containing protein n=1 Tax=Oryza sativa subsp. indica TaxID=39946 RepID=B8AD54_ORYSI|nr:hypothetical protein OsI_00305 [Oryza sativa Indica Group]
MIIAASLLHVAAAVGNETSSNNNTSCAPARCGNLTIRYPFSLSGVQPPYCGYPAFDLTCDNGTGRAFLSRTFRDHLFLVDNIFYENSSLVAAVQTTFAGDADCPIPDFNVTSSLSSFPLIISNANKYLLVVVYSCTLPDDTRLQRPCANQTTTGAYISDRWNSTPPSGIPGNCISVSLPVRGGDGMKLLDQHYEQLTADTIGGRIIIGGGSIGGNGNGSIQQYERLISDGFVLEWQRAVTRDPDCDACRRNGGECRFQQLMFQCVSCHGLICSNSTSPCDQDDDCVKAFSLLLRELFSCIHPPVDEGCLRKLAWQPMTLSQEDWSNRKLNVRAILIVKDLQSHEVTCENEEIARKITLVGLWCIQTAPGNRPSMSKVIEMLEKNINELEMPPKPILSCPAVPSYFSSYS